MSEPHIVDDYIVLAVPSHVSLDDEGVFKQLQDAADRNIVAQYRGRRPQPRALVIHESEWLITSDWREVERFQPAHDCAECRAGNERAVALLKEHPDKRLALGNLHYMAVW